VILKTGWYRSQFCVSELSVVFEVNPAYISQQCNGCRYTNKNNRTSQSKFRCLECRLSENADINASKNIPDNGARSVEREDFTVVDTGNGKRSYSQDLLPFVIRCNIMECRINQYKYS